MFFDQKLAGLEIILHGERIATNGDIRLLPTPEPRWGPTEEVYGEDPFHIGILATAFTQGLQGDHPVTGRRRRC